MKTYSNASRSGRFLHWLTTCGQTVLLAAGFALAVSQAGAQTTNAYDDASAYGGNFNSGDNHGSGFGAWTIATSGNSGKYIAGGTPTPITSGSAFALWNDQNNASASATRSFNSSLAAGQTFYFARQLNGLNTGTETAEFQLQDSNGNVLFNFWHAGGDNADGHYADATTASGTASGFAYAYQTFKSYSFQLTSSTTYVFRNITDNNTLTGTINGTIAKVAFVRKNVSASGGGTDFRFDKLIVTAANPPTFSAVSPAPGALSVATNAAIAATIGAGSAPLNTGSVTLKVDNNPVSPTVTGNSTLLNVSFTPSLSYASQHTAQLVVQDNNTVSYSNTWSFTTGYPGLPVALPGTYTISNAQDLTVFTASGEGWLGTNYNTNSSRTLYTRATMAVLNNAGENGGGGFYCGYHFELGNQEGLIVGNNWSSVNWSYDGEAGGAGQHDLNPATLVNLNEPHTIVTRVDYNPAGKDTVTVYLDPDLSQPELAQSSGIITTFLQNNSFDNLRLRCGNGNNAITVFSNVMVSATPVGVGFPVDSAARFQALIPGENIFDVSTATPISAQVIPGSLPITNVTLKLDNNPVTPAITTAGGTTNVEYQPPTRLSGGVVHTVELDVTDSSSTTYVKTWSFTTGYDSLPLVLAGPISATNNVDSIVFTANNDLWIGTNYQSSSSRTLYARFSMDFDQVDVFGGLDFYQGNTERLLVGKTGGGGSGVNTTWSLYNSGGSPTDASVPPVTSIVTGDWHTFVVRADYSAGGNTSVKVWLDPDFTQTEQSQATAPLALTLNNTFDNIRLRAGFTALANYTNLMFGSNAVQVGFAAATVPTFQTYVPADGTMTAPANTPVGVTAVFGNAGINSNAVTMTLDGNPVTPGFVKTSTSLAISYQPPTPFAAGSSHTAAVSLTDSNGTPASTSWSFTVDPYPSLPVTYAGPLTITNDSTGTTIFSSQNGWLAGNTYANANFSGVLWTKFSINVDNLDGETGSGGGFCGLDFYNGTSERLIIGNNYPSLNWSYDAFNWGAGTFSSTPIPFNEWHTIVVKTTYNSSNVDFVKIWLDPNLNGTESGQNPQADFLADVPFDSVRLRAGNGAASATYSNVVISAVSPFATSVPQSVLSIAGGQLSWTSVGTLQEAPAVTGPWTDSANQSNPQALNTTNVSRFYRLRQ